MIFIAFFIVPVLVYFALVADKNNRAKAVRELNVANVRRAQLIAKEKAIKDEEAAENKKAKAAAKSFPHPDPAKVVFVPNEDEPGSEELLRLTEFAAVICLERELEDVGAMEKRLKKVALAHRVFPAATEVGFSEEKWMQMLDEYDREHN